MGEIVGEVVQANSERELIIKYHNLKRERDALVADIDLSSIESGLVTPTAIMKLLPRLSDFKRIYELTGIMEKVADSLIKKRVEVLS